MEIESNPSLQVVYEHFQKYYYIEDTKLIDAILAVKRNLRTRVRLSLQPNNEEQKYTEMVSARALLLRGDREGKGSHLPFFYARLATLVLVRHSPPRAS